jgi:hypothetical protein
MIRSKSHGRTEEGKAARRKANINPVEWASIRAQQRDYRRRNPVTAEQNRRADLRKYYGPDFTIEKWNEMFAAQGSRCAVCQSPEPGRKSGHWCTDHDHKTGRVRGILCSGCNTALGHAKDDPLRLRLLAEYLER